MLYDGWVLIALLSFPKAIESFYILWRVTGDEKWRHRGWHVFQALEREAKTQSGYACVDRIHTKRPILLDSMPRSVNTFSIMLNC